MKIIEPSREQAHAGLRAMKAIAGADGAIGPAATNLLAAAQRNFLKTSFVVDELAPIAPEELGAAFADTELARQFSQGMSVVSLADGPPGPKARQNLLAYARALGVETPEVDLVSRLAEHHLTLFKLDFLRRSHIADMAKNELANEGFVGLVKAFAGFSGHYEDPAKARRYRALGGLGAGTFGRAFFDYVEKNRFSFPGEKHGFPEAGVYHDYAHVLSGYATDSPGEVEVGGFVAGFRKNNPFMVILFVMMTFSAGVNVTPLPQPHQVGILATEGLADGFFRALARGMAMKVDISEGWDGWPFMDRPLDEVRATLGVPPP
jgi:hypothetical protein